MTYLDKPMIDPNIGLASTRQLLTELKDRGLFESYYIKEGTYLAADAERLLNVLPTRMLDYRVPEDDELLVLPVPDGVDGYSVGAHVRVDSYAR